ncbi:MAG: ABC transporter substrate-binding protein [Acidobacteriota bacterium]
MKSIWTGIGILVVLLPVPCRGRSEPTSIGLFLPTRGPLAASGRRVERAARLALERAVRSWPAGPRFRLRVASSDLPWGAQTRDLVKLIYEDRVEVVIGALDGRSAHLAEQVITRARGEALLFTLSSDPTLTQIRLPWVFRLVPDDRRQAQALMGQVGRSNASAKAVTLILGDDYDTRSLVSVLRRVAGSASLSMAWRKAWAGRRASRIPNAESLLLIGPPEASARVLEALDFSRPVRWFGPLRLNCPEFWAALAGGGGDPVALIATYDSDFSAWRDFRQRYSARYAEAPALLEAYAFDAVSLAAAVISRTGSDVEAIQQALRRSRFPGVTGLVRFDEKGDRIGHLSWMTWTRNDQVSPPNSRETLGQPAVQEGEGGTAPTSSLQWVAERHRQEAGSERNAGLPVIFSIHRGRPGMDRP